MTKLHKTVFNVNGCTVVKHEQSESSVTITVKLTKGNACRCSCCGRRGKLYDNGREHRVWRTLDLGTKMGFIKMDTYRVKCKKCGVKTVKVPWANVKSGFTESFEQQIAWAVRSMSKSAVSELYRIAWNTVGEIADRVWRHHITVVVDHDRRCVIRTHEGYGKEVLQLFMNELSEKQRAAVELVTCDGAKWIRSCIEENLPNAERCVDGFHVVQWATDALGKAPENLTESQQKKLELIANQNPKLYRAYQLKEELRIILKMPYPDAVVNLDRWLWRASHSRIDAMKKLYEKVKRNKAGILSTIRLGMSNAKIDATNNKIKLLIRTAYGFRNMENMLSLIMLSCSYVEVKIAYKWSAENKESLNKAA